MSPAAAAHSAAHTEFVGGGRQRGGGGGAPLWLRQDFAQQHEAQGEVGRQLACQHGGDLNLKVGVQQLTRRHRRCILAAKAAAAAAAAVAALKVERASGEAQHNGGARV